MKEKSVIIGKDSDELIRGLVEKEKRGKGKEKEKDLDKFIKELISGEKKPVSKKEKKLEEDDEDLLEKYFFPVFLFIALVDLGA